MVRRRTLSPLRNLLIRLVDKVGILGLNLRILSALDTAKEIARLSSTAGLSKDVVDLQAAKLNILTEEIVSLHSKVSLLEAENAQLRSQIQHLKPVGFMENMGVLWKRTAQGFEKIPYCKECPNHPIMTPLHEARTWVCATGDHIAPFSVKPPA